MGKNFKKEYRSTDDVGKFMLDFLLPRWNVGTTFIHKEIIKERKKHPLFRNWKSKNNDVSSEKRILEKMKELGLVRRDKKELKLRDGQMGSIVIWTVRANNPDALQQGIEAGIKRKSYVHKPKEPSKGVQQKIDFPLHSADIELLQDKIKKLTKEVVANEVKIEGLQCELDEVRIEKETLQEQVEDSAHKAQSTNGLIKTCPKCKFNIEKYTHKYGNQIQAIMADCE